MSKLNWHTASGIIKYDPPRPGMTKRTEWWSIIKVDREITRYYRWWVDKEVVNPLGLEHISTVPKIYFDKMGAKGLSQPSWDAHISIVRGEKPHASVSHLWKKYDGERITFCYKHHPRKAGDTTGGDGPYWFVEVFCPRLDEIRDELKLVTGWKYHLTIGRTWS